MTSSKPFHHRSTLKQTNRPFKSKHSTKNALRTAEKGKIERVGVKSKKTLLNKQDRKRAAKLDQQKKRDQINKINRLFQGKSGAPRLIVKYF